MRDNRMRISLREVIYVLAALVLFFEIYLMGIGIYTDYTFECS